MIKVVGLDPSLRNWGIALGTYSRKDQSLTIADCNLVRPLISESKQVRKNSKDLEAASQLYKKTLKTIEDFQAEIIFIEVPVGSQSARAMASYGICIGVLGALANRGIPFLELTPSEVKIASVGTKTATKKEMISWAVDNHPEYDWPTVKRKGVDSINESVVEHLADAVAAIHAGIQTQPFKLMLSLLKEPL